MLALVLAACGSPAFDGAVYRGPEAVFRIPDVPPTWRRVEVTGTALEFRDDAHDATIAFSGRCGRNEDDVPLAALTQHLFIQFTAREILKQEVVPFDSREAMHTVLSAKLDGVPKVFDVWVLKKDSCVYDLVLIAAAAHYAAGEPAFTRVVHGFSTLSPHGS